MGENGEQPKPALFELPVQPVAFGPVTFNFAVNVARVSDKNVVQLGFASQELIHAVYLDPDDALQVSEAVAAAARQAKSGLEVARKFPGPERR